MIVLDTNVISEPLRPLPDRAVLHWFNRQVRETLFLTTITLAELRHGIAIMPDGRRKRSLGNVLDQHLIALFGRRILPFDQAAADAYGLIRARAKVSGRGIATVDGYIAAIAAARGFSIASRDVEPFEAAGLRVIDPWKSSDFS